MPLWAIRQRLVADGWEGEREREGDKRRRQMQCLGAHICTHPPTRPISIMHTTLMARVTSHVMGTKRQLYVPNVQQSCHRTCCIIKRACENLIIVLCLCSPDKFLLPKYMQGLHTTGMNMPRIFRNKFLLLPSPYFGGCA